MYSEYAEVCSWILQHFLHYANWSSSVGVRLKMLNYSFEQIWDNIKSILIVPEFTAEALFSVMDAGFHVSSSTNTRKWFLLDLNICDTKYNGQHDLNVNDRMMILFFIGTTGAQNRYSPQFVKAAKLLHWNGHYKPWSRTSAFTDVWDKWFIADPTGKFQPVRRHTGDN